MTRPSSYLVVSILFGVLTVCAWAAEVPASPPPKSPQPQAQSTPVGVTATLKEAAKQKKHVTVLVFRSDQEDAQVLKVKALLDKLADDPAWQKKALFARVDLAHPQTADKKFIDEYGLRFAPLPLTLLFAPNGALVKHFAQQPYTDKQLAAAFAGPVRAEVMKDLQDGRTVLVFVPGKDEKQNADSLAVARKAVQDKQLGDAALVTADPKQAEAKDLFDYYSLNSLVSDATVYYLFPPCRFGGQTVAPADTDDLVDAVLQSLYATGYG